MDFFEAQAVAKKRTSRLVVLFVLAVLGTIVAAYAAGLLILGQTQRYERDRAAVPSYTERQPLWQPKLFAGVAFTTLAVVGLASFFKWRQFSAGGSVVARNLGGREVDSRTTDFHERRLLNVVEEMAIAAGTPVPAVYILDDEPGINAFAAGLTTSDAVVAVTRGTLEKLTRDELQGVIGHEFSHILNGDMRLNMRLTSLLFGILILGIIGRSIIWSLRFSGARRSRNEKGGGGGVAVVIAAGIALLIIGYIGYFFGRLIQAAVSRQREFLADASAVQFTRNPAGIAGALKKIGGYALGSSMNSTKSAEIGHFFFAQGFRSRFGGLWATHPPLPERVRAIDPSFDGTFFSPPEVVNVAEQSFVSAGLAPVRPPSASRAASGIPPLLPMAAARLAPSTVGTLTAEQIADAHDLLESLPPRLRDAAHDPTEAPILLFALLLDHDPAVHEKQRQIINARPIATTNVLKLDELEALLQPLPAALRLPLVQLSLPALRPLSPTALDEFLGTLDTLVQADKKVSIFEFALQILVTHTVKLARNPSNFVEQYHSLNAVTSEIAIVLSALARAATPDPNFAPEAFAAGASQLKLIEPQLRYVEADESQFERLNSALDKLAAASFPIRQRTIIAGAHVVSADGQVSITEAELLRAVSAALDCPMPPLRASAGVTA